MRSFTYLSIFILSVTAIFYIYYTQHNLLDTHTPVACTTEAKICPDGSAVGRIGPNCDFAQCPGESTSAGEESDPMIVIDSPQAGTVITSPVTITGRARGPWFFEASFPISIVNWDGLIIGEGIATARDDWMTEDLVPFSATISYTVATQTPYARGTIILNKDNPSGLPEHDDFREIPVIFSEVSE